MMSLMYVLYSLASRVFSNTVTKSCRAVLSVLPLLDALLKARTLASDVTHTDYDMYGGIW